MSNAVTIDLRKASEGTCICFKQNGDPFVYVDEGKFQDIPWEHIKIFVSSIVEQCTGKKPIIEKPKYE